LLDDLHQVHSQIKFKKLSVNHACWYVLIHNLITNLSLKLHMSTYQLLLYVILILH